MSGEFFDSLVAELKGELGQGFGQIRAFVETQGKQLAGQAALIAEQRINGSLKNDDALYEFFLDGLKANTENFARSVAMLTALTIERAWNAVANAIWGGLKKMFAAAGIPAPLIPNSPPHI